MPKTLVNTGFFALIQDQKFFLIGTVSYVSTVSAATRPLYTAGASRYNIRESGGNGNTFPPKKEYWADIKKGQPYKTSNANFFFYRPLCRKSKKNEVKKGGLFLIKVFIVIQSRNEKRQKKSSCQPIKA